MIPAILLRFHYICIKYDVKSKTKAKIRTVCHKRSHVSRSPHLIPTNGSRKVITIDMISTKVRKESLLRAEPTCTSKRMAVLRPGRSTRWSLHALKKALRTCQRTNDAVRLHGHVMDIRDVRSSALSCVRWLDQFLIILMLKWMRKL